VYLAGAAHEQQDEVRQVPDRIFAGEEWGRFVALVIFGKVAVVGTRAVHRPRLVLVTNSWISLVGLDEFL
jgi:hypothetical protein